jgi:hypothetical protein
MWIQVSNGLNRDDFEIINLFYVKEEKEGY